MDKEKINKKTVIIVFIVVVLGVGFGVYRYQNQQQVSLSSEELIGRPAEKAEEAKEPVESPVGEKIVEKANFSIGGNLLQSDLGGWIVLYDDAQTGAMAAKKTLIFTNESLCDLGQGEKKCDLSTFEIGTQIEVEGVQSGNTLKVTKMKKIAGPEGW